MQKVHILKLHLISNKPFDMFLPHSCQTLIIYKYKPYPYLIPKKYIYLEIRWCHFNKVHVLNPIRICNSTANNFNGFIKNKLQTTLSHFILTLLPLLPPKAGKYCTHQLLKTPASTIEHSTFIHETRYEPSPTQHFIHFLLIFSSISSTPISIFPKGHMVYEFDYL